MWISEKFQVQTQNPAYCNDHTNAYKIIWNLIKEKQISLCTIVQVQITYTQINFCDKFTLIDFIHT